MVTRGDISTSVSDAVRSRLLHAVTAAAFLAPFVTVILISLTVFAPEPYQETPPGRHDYSMDAMQQAVEWRNVQALQDRFAGFGSRFMGQPGAYAAEDFIRQAFHDAGLEVYEQENWTVVPRTEFRELYLNHGAGHYGTPVSDVEIFPFMPNHLQPVTTPDEGIEGELLLITPDALRNRAGLDDCIGLIDTAEGMVPEEYGYDWSRYARLGLKGLVVSHRGGLEQVPWRRVAAEREGMVSGNPINFVRVVATDGIFGYIGRRVRVRVRVRFEEVPNTTLVGILRAGGTSSGAPNSRALMIHSSYDACSVLPDRAPGVMQAVWPATQLALLQGLAPYRDELVRDVVFVAFGAQMMARDGDNNLLRLLDENILRKERNPLKDVFRFNRNDANAEGARRLAYHQDARVQPWRERYHANAQQFQAIQSLLKLFDEPRFLDDLPATAGALDPGARAFLEEQLHHTLNTILFGLTEDTVQAKLAYLQSADTSLEGEPFAHFLRARSAQDRVAALAGLGMESLLDGRPRTRETLDRYQFRERCRARLLELRAYHERQARRFEKDVALIQALNPYEELLVFDTALLPSEDGAANETLSFTNGHWAVNAQMRSMVSLMASARERLAARPGQETIRRELQIPALPKLHHIDVELHTRPLPNRSANMWTQFGYLMFKFVNFGRSPSYLRFSDPVDLPFMHDLVSLRHSFAVLGESVLSLAHGNGSFPPIQVGWMKKQFGGRVLAAGIGQSIAPSYPLQGAILCGRPYLGPEYSWPGYYDHLLIQTDVYGRYQIVNCATDFWVDQYIWAKGYSPVAAWHGRDGRIAWMKDEAEDGQRLYKSVNLNWFKGDVEDITVVAFRAAPIAFLDLTNPQAMKDYAGITLLDRNGLAPLRKECIFNAPGSRVHYVEPDRFVYAALESGSTDNDLAKVVRGFITGPPEDGGSGGEGNLGNGEIDGAGYLAAAHPIMEAMPREIARSMVRLNGKRLDLQNQYGMADRQTIAYHRKSGEFLQEAETPDQPDRQVQLEARDAAIYATLVHPILRRSVVEAVVGILWYLGLLVPFVYFLEKLLFCFSDVRKQVAAQALVFLAVFGLLRLLHPAFAMVRSSLMILLGFVVILIAGGISVLFAGKFKENLEDLRKKRGRVDAAEVSRLGVMGSAFMLGLNNMHRRKLRTWLTCGALTLTTFAMICFTSVTSDIVEESTAIAKAPYSGLLLKQLHFRPFSDAELFAIRTRFADSCTVSLRRMYLGTQHWEDQRGYNPEIEIAHEVNGTVRTATCSSILQFGHAEPLRNQFRMLTDTPWFTQADEKATEAPYPVLIPDAVADRLGITVQQVNAGPVAVRLNGGSVTVHGIFDADSLGQATDLDGDDILPYDIESMPRIQQVDNFVVAEAGDPRIPASQIILAPLRDLEIKVPNGTPVAVSVALVMPETSYRENREIITSFLEQSGKPAYYGLDGVAYRGQRARQRRVGGLLDLIIPLVIAGLTVLNTMRGSVYERRDEIEVYNAVGIAPRYVFFIFFAESFVYAVVGAVLGYLLSQGMGRVLTALDLTGGMNMAFTSITTTYASVAVVAAVLVSTYFPARTAMQIAQPAEDAGWRLPEPEGDRLILDLPFCFDFRDRMAIVTFFERFLLDHGEGGAGTFYSSEPKPELRVEHEPGAVRALVPCLTATIWIKPFDLGVSQKLELAMLPDPETREYRARLALLRISGSREAWMRLNRTFVARVRRHFLHWRAVPARDRESLYAEARKRFEQAMGGQSA